MIFFSLQIGADGANSIVRKQMNVDYLSLSYNQMGVVATVELEDEVENNMAWQKFLHTGPIALLPLNSNTSSLVWSTNTEHAKELLKLEPSKFIDKLNEAFVSFGTFYSNKWF